MEKERRFYLREWREYRGLTQQQLADRIDMTKGHISNLETGRKKYSEEVISLLAQALNCEDWELLGRNPMIAPEAVSSIYERIPATSRPAALSMLRSLAGDAAKKAG